MDFGSLIREAWLMTWRHRFLWVLGLFAVGSVSTCAPPGPSFQWQMDQGDLERIAPQGGRELAAAAGDVAAWIAANAALVVAAACFLALLGLAFFVVSLLAQGGISKATLDLAQNREISHGAAWRAGFHLFWRYVGLWLLLALLAIVVVIVVGVFVGLPFGLAIAFRDAAGPLAVIGAIFAVIAGLLAIPLVIFVTIILMYAQRHIAANDVGPWLALRAGADLLRRYLWTSILSWLLSLALGIAVGIAMLIIGGVLTAVLGLVGVGVFAAVGMTALLFAYAGLAVLSLIAAMWLMSAVANAFFWSFWSIVYLRLIVSGTASPSDYPSTGP